MSQPGHRANAVHDSMRLAPGSSMTDNNPNGRTAESTIALTTKPTTKPDQPKGAVPFSRRKSVNRLEHFLRREDWDSPP